MDVFVITFSAKTIIDEWDISPQAQCIVLSAAVIGMTLGNLLLAFLVVIVMNMKN